MQKTILSTASCHKIALARLHECRMQPDRSKILHSDGSKNEMMTKNLLCNTYQTGILCLGAANKTVGG